MISHHDVLAFIEYEKYFRSCGMADKNGRTRDGERDQAFADRPDAERALAILAALSSMRRW